MRPSRGAPWLALAALPDGYRVTIVVQNDLVHRGDVLVRIVPRGGAPSLLGGAGPGEEATLEYRARSLGGSFSLTARTGDGRLYGSRAFTLFPDAVVVWRLERNELQVLGSSDSSPPSPSRGGRILLPNSR